MDLRHVYAAGYVLAIVGSLVTVAGTVLAGSVGIGVVSLGATVALVFGLRNVLTKETFDRDHSLGHRVANASGALLVVGLGLLLLAVGLVSLNTFA